MGKSVLVVDDNASARRVMRSVVKGWGATCTPVATPAAALALLSSGERFDVAVLDLYMPAMDGRQLGEAIRKLPTGGDLPLILLTNSVWQAGPQDERLFAATLTKPANDDILRERVLAAVSPFEAAVAAIETAGGHRREDGPPVATTSLRILLAEDNPINQRVEQLMLAKLGHEVDTVSNGLEAVEAVRQGSYDVVLMDVQMPHMDGLRATEIIRAELAADAQPSIVALTANSLRNDWAACARAGMNALLSKPIRTEELGTALVQVAAQRRDRATTAGTGDVDQYIIWEPRAVTPIRRQVSADGWW